MQKKLIFLALTGLLCLSLAGCGQSGSTSPEGGSSPQAAQLGSTQVSRPYPSLEPGVAEKDLEALADLASYPL